MKRILVFLAALALCSAAYSQNLEEGFQAPPREAKMHVWWHWMNGNISKDGIRKDIEWMSKTGIGGFHQFDAGGNNFGRAAEIVPKLPYMSDGWKDAFQYAMKVADSLEMDVAIASAPGWSSTGGPWVKPENAMKKLTWRTVEVTGGKTISMKLPEVYDVVGKFQNMGNGSKEEPWSMEVAVVAVRLPDAEKTLKDLGAKVTALGGDFTVDQLTDGDLANAVELPKNGEGEYSWICYEFPEPQTIKALSFVGGPIRSMWASESPTYVNFLQCSNDGKTFTDVCRIPSSNIAQVTIQVPATTAKYFRLMVSNPQRGNGTAISEFNLYPVVKVNHAEEKAGFTSPHDLDLYKTSQTTDPVQEVVCLDEYVKKGTLKWKAPEGRWRIYHFGASLTGKQNHPAPPEATGLEVDKIDKEAWMDYFRTYVDMYKEAAGGNVGQHGIQYLLVDSYEAEFMTWTKSMFSEFKARRGYDLMEWLPALTGQILYSSDQTEKFLFDWRETIGELFTENYGRIKEIVKEYNMKGTFLEAHENGRVYVGDGMDLKMHATMPMCAIWMPDGGGGSKIEMASADIKESSSVAHVYGQNIAGAESFTAPGMGGNAYSYHPGNLKGTADIAMSLGLNKFVVHESAHQPSDNHRPGLGLMIFGQWFNRHDTWADYAKYWGDYISRSCYMLQQGKYVADILYYYGEDKNVTGIYGLELPEVPEGYSYDFINPYGVMNVLSVDNGVIRTKSGMQYKVLVLGDYCGTMSNKVLAAIDKLVRSGAVLVGKAPEKPAELQDDEAEFQRLVDDIWFSGRSNVHTGSIRNALAASKVAPDFQYVAPAEMKYVHRHLDNGTDIYWVRNFSDNAIVADLTLRNGEGIPMVWHPETGAKNGVLCEKVNDVNKVTIPMVANDAVFIVFDGKAREAYVEVPTTESTLVALDGEWKVAFEEGVGAPKKAVTFPELKSFSESSEEGIKYFSGTATYTKKFKVNAKELESMKDVAIDLGKVANMADVYINGKHAGFVWKAPFRIDGIKPLLKGGSNEIRIDVTNSWQNRLIGDAQEGVEKKYTYTGMAFYRADSPLVTSGLLGPAVLIGIK